MWRNRRVESYRLHRSASEAVLALCVVLLSTTYAGETTPDNLKDKDCDVFTLFTFVGVEKVSDKTVVEELYNYPCKLIRTNDGKDKGKKMQFVLTGCPSLSSETELTNLIYASFWRHGAFSESEMKFYYPLTHVGTTQYNVLGATETLHKFTYDSPKENLRHLENFKFTFMKLYNSNTLKREMTYLVSTKLPFVPFVELNVFGNVSFLNPLTTTTELEKFGNFVVLRDKPHHKGTTHVFWTAPMVVFASNKDGELRRVRGWKVIHRNPSKVFLEVSDVLGSQFPGSFETACYRVVSGDYMYPELFESKKNAALSLSVSSTQQVDIESDNDKCFVNIYEVSTGELTRVQRVKITQDMILEVGSRKKASVDDADLAALLRGGTHTATFSKNYRVLGRDEFDVVVTDVSNELTGRASNGHLHRDTGNCVLRYLGWVTIVDDGTLILVKSADSYNLREIESDNSRTRYRLTTEKGKYVWASLYSFHANDACYARLCVEKVPVEWLGSNALEDCYIFIINKQGILHLHFAAKVVADPAPDRESGKQRRILRSSFPPNEYFLDEIRGLEEGKLRIYISDLPRSYPTDDEEVIFLRCESSALVVAKAKCRVHIGMHREQITKRRDLTAAKTGMKTNFQQSALKKTNQTGDEVFTLFTTVEGVENMRNYPCRLVRTKKGTANTSTEFTLTNCHATSAQPDIDAHLYTSSCRYGAFSRSRDAYYYPLKYIGTFLETVNAVEGIFPKFTYDISAQDPTIFNSANILFMQQLNLFTYELEMTFVVKRVDGEIKMAVYGDVSRLQPLTVENLNSNFGYFVQHKSSTKNLHTFVIQPMELFVSNDLGELVRVSGCKVVERCSDYILVENWNQDATSFNKNFKIQHCRVVAHDFMYPEKYAYATSETNFSLPAQFMVCTDFPEPPPLDTGFVKIYHRESEKLLMIRRVNFENSEMELGRQKKANLIIPNAEHATFPPNDTFARFSRQYNVIKHNPLDEASMERKAGSSICKFISRSATAHIHTYTKYGELTFLGWFTVLQMKNHIRVEGIKANGDVLQMESLDSTTYYRIFTGGHKYIWTQKESLYVDAYLPYANLAVKEEPEKQIPDFSRNQFYVSLINSESILERQLVLDVVHSIGNPQTLLILKSSFLRRNYDKYACELELVDWSTYKINLSDIYRNVPIEDDLVAFESEDNRAIIVRTPSAGLIGYQNVKEDIKTESSPPKNKSDIASDKSSDKVMTLGNLTENRTNSKLASKPAEHQGPMEEKQLSSKSVAR